MSGGAAIAAGTAIVGSGPSLPADTPDSRVSVAMPEAPDFNPRPDLVAAIKANRQARSIPPDSALPKPTATTDAELASQSRAEIENALKALSR